MRNDPWTSKFQVHFSKYSIFFKNSGNLKMFQIPGVLNPELLIGRQRLMPEALNDEVHTSAPVKGGVAQFTYTLPGNGTSSSGKPIEVPGNVYR